MAPSDDTPTRAMTAAQAAAYTGLSVSHIRTLTSRREIPYIKIGSAVRYMRDDIDRWLEAKRVYTKKEINERAAGYCITRR